MMEMKREKKLQVRDLKISFRTNGGKVQAVRNISFDLHKGETLAIVGESGSGKSVTSKAILGILAGNSIVEGGEILYDGQDLLKITEDDFYRLRGDKIAMIFQDPLSSLNPIMKIGKQLTEAMLLKGKARQRSCRSNFNTHLKTLQEYMVEANPASAETYKKMCKDFDTFEVEHTKQEHAYNMAREYAADALEEVRHLLFLIEKNAITDADAASVKQVKEFARASINPFVVPESRRGEILANTTFKRKEEVSNLAVKLKALEDVLSQELAKLEEAEPNFFAKGYFDVFGDSNKAPMGSIAEMNAFYEEYCQQNFMDKFALAATEAITAADAKYLTRREEVIAALAKAIPELEKGTVDAFRPTAAELCKLVEASVDKLDIIKDSAACTFTGSMKDFLSRYQEGVRTNGKKEAKYNREVARAEKKAAQGKSYKVAMATTVDLERVKTNILTLMRNLKAHYEERNEREPKEDKSLKTARLIEYFKDNASGMVVTITKQAARNKALKLMAEVGIPEPRKRYKQYPFEFSGGMRQRIVIAIALAANPDILICDEPTTALDVTIQAQILELIQELKKKRNLSVIFITHDLGVVANMADSIAVMYAGKIVEYGTSEEVFYAPAHPYTWALLSSMPDLDSKEQLVAIPGTPPDMRFPPKGDAFADRNAYAMKIDFEQQPPAFPISDTHWAATWLLHPDMPHGTVEPPKMVTDRIRKMKARMEENANG